MTDISKTPANLSQMPEASADGSASTAANGKRDMAQGPWDDEAKETFTKKSSSEYFDPCQDYAKRSIRCLLRNNGDRTFCGDFFQAYRDCKQKWLDEVKKDRKLLGRKAIW